MTPEEYIDSLVFQGIRILQTDSFTPEGVLLEAILRGLEVKRTLTKLEGSNHDFPWNGSGISNHKGWVGFGMGVSFGKGDPFGYLGRMGEGGFVNGLERRFEEVQDWLSFDWMYLHQHKKFPSSKKMARGWGSSDEFEKGSPFVHGIVLFF